MTDSDNPRLAWDYLPLYCLATVILLVVWGYTQHRGEIDENGDVIKPGKRLGVAFRPFLIFIGGLDLFVLLPAKVQDFFVEPFVIACSLFFVVLNPIYLLYLWLRQIRREHEEKVEAVMSFDKTPMHGTAEIATPEEQRRAGL